MQNFQMVGGELDAILYGFGYKRWRDIMSARLHHQDRSRRHAPLLLSSVLCNRVLQSKRILLFSCLDTRIGTASNDDWIRSAIQSQQVSQIAIDQCRHKLPTAGWDGRQKKRKKIDPGKLHPPIAIYGTAASAWTGNFYRRIGFSKFATGIPRQLCERITFSHLHIQFNYREHRQKQAIVFPGRPSTMLCIVNQVNKVDLPESQLQP